jgi:hypothetical protein
MAGEPRSLVGQRQQAGPAVVGVRPPHHPPLLLQPVHGLAGRADPDGEGGGDVRHPGPGVVAQMAQGLELRGHEGVFGAEAVAEGVVHTRLAADQVVEEGDEVDRAAT